MPFGIAAVGTMIAVTSRSAVSKLCTWNAVLAFAATTLPISVMDGGPQYVVPSKTHVLPKAPAQRVELMARLGLSP
jgi:hypothetical protein